MDVTVGKICMLNYGDIVKVIKGDGSNMFLFVVKFWGFNDGQ